MRCESHRFALARALRRGAEITIRLRPHAERHRALRDHVETRHYFDELTGELYEPAEPPHVHDPAGDEDWESGLGLDSPPAAFQRPLTAFCASWLASQPVPPPHLQTCSQANDQGRKQ